MKYYKKIEGERVYLSPYNLDDIQIFTKWLNDRKVTDGLGDSHVMFTLPVEKEWLENEVKKGNYSFAIVLSDGDEVIGSIGLFEIIQANIAATVGLFIGEAENRGKGYGTEAMRLLLGYAFDVLNFHNIRLGVYEYNIGAYKSYLKVGFREMGRRRKAHYLDNKYHDVIYMDITREDWYELHG